MINYKVFFTYILSHLVSVSASYFVIGFHFRYFFSWYCCTEKIYAKKGFQREFCLEEREKYEEERSERVCLGPSIKHEKRLFKIMKNILQLRVCDFTVTQDCMQQIISHPE